MIMIKSNLTTKSTEGRVQPIAVCLVRTGINRITKV